jgi:hypothetical protein
MPLVLRIWSHFLDQIRNRIVPQTCKSFEGLLLARIGLYICRPMRATTWSRPHTFLLPCRPPPTTFPSHVKARSAAPLMLEWLVIIQSGSGAARSAAQGLTAAAEVTRRRRGSGNLMPHASAGCTGTRSTGWPYRRHLTSVGSFPQGCEDIRSASLSPSSCYSTIFGEIAPLSNSCAPNLIEAAIDPCVSWCLRSSSAL